MNKEIVIYDKNPNLSMVLSLFLEQLTVQYALTLQDIEKELSHTSRLLLIVEHEFHLNTALRIQDYQRHYPQLKSIYLSNSQKKILQWQAHVDKKLSDWNLGDHRLTRLIQEMTKTHCLSTLQKQGLKDF